MDRSYKWPSYDDICWVPVEKIITSLEALSLTSVGGRQFKLSNEDAKKIANVFTL